MTPQPQKILIIGGPAKSKCYSGKGITRVPYQPLDVLRLGHLYDYDVVIFWPSWLDHFECNMTRGEFSKALPRIITYYDMEHARYSQPLSSTDQNNDEIHVDLGGLEFPEAEGAKRKDNKKKSKLNAPKPLPCDIRKDLPDSDKPVDYGMVMKLLNGKLLEIMAGITHRQLAFIIIPSDYGGQNPDDIIGWMKLPITLDFDPDREDEASFTAAGQHPIYAILRGMNSIVKEWTFRFVAGHLKDEYNNHRDRADIDIVLQLPLNDYFLTMEDVHVTGRTGHTDRGGFTRSLMILSEQGGLAFIPKLKSIDEFVGLISNSMSTSPVTSSVPSPATVESPAISPATKLTLELGNNCNLLSGQDKEGSAQLVVNALLRGNNNPYVFQRHGSLWILRFNGKKPFLQNHTDGLTYISALLGKPNENIPAIELHQYVNPISSGPQSERVLKDINTIITKAAEDNVTPAIGIHTREFGSQVIHDDTSKISLAKKLKQLMIDLAEAKSHGNETCAAEIQEEITAIEKEIAAATVGNRKINRKFRPKNDEKARDAIRKAIDAAIKSIKQHDSHLALHLSNHINKGYSLVYKSDLKEKTVWTL